MKVMVIVKATKNSEPAVARSFRMFTEWNRLRLELEETV